MKTDDSALDQLAPFFHGWHVEQIQLSPRRGRTIVSRAASRLHRVLRLRAGSALVIRGAVHKSSYCAFFSASEQAAVRVLGQPLRAHELMVAGADASVDLFVPSGADLRIIVVESGAAVSRRALRICEGAAAHDLDRLTQCIKRTDKRHRDFDAKLVDRLRQVFTRAGGVPLDRGANTLRIAAVMSACRLIEQRWPESITLRDLSRHCGVADRTLEYGFRQVYDTTPLTFIRSLRLTRTRMALLRAAAGASISQTAGAFGFTHMGQYSRDYRRLFGETPSMTLARGQSQRAGTQTWHGTPPVAIPTMRSVP